MKRLSCSDAGFPNCQHVMEGENDEDVLRQARAHGQSAHGLSNLGPEVENNLRARIKNV